MDPFTSEPRALSLQIRALRTVLGDKMPWCRYLAEVLGDPRMSGLGRLRRHMATASLCKLAVANASPALRDTRRMAKALALALKTLAERPDYEVRAKLAFRVGLLDPRDVPLHACTLSGKGLLLTTLPGLVKASAHLVQVAGT